MWSLSFSAAAVCPDVLKAKKHFNLVVQDTNITLPGGENLPGFTYNGSYIGPVIYATLGEEISIDVLNNSTICKMSGL